MIPWSFTFLILFHSTEGNRADADTNFTSLALSEFPESTHSLFSKLFNTLSQCDAAVETIMVNDM